MVLAAVLANMGRTPVQRRNRYRWRNVVFEGSMFADRPRTECTWYNFFFYFSSFRNAPFFELRSLRGLSDVVARINPWFSEPI